VCTKNGQQSDQSPNGNVFESEIYSNSRFRHDDRKSDSYSKYRDVESKVDLYSKFRVAAVT
jgi:hypothetical protein